MTTPTAIQEQNKIALDAQGLEAAIAAHDRILAIPASSDDRELIAGIIRAYLAALASRVSDDALRSALETIASLAHNLPRSATADQIDTIARAALASPAQEPVAWMHPIGAIWRADNCPAGIDFTKDGWIPLGVIAAPPAPAQVAVKALERDFANAAHRTLARENEQSRRLFHEASHAATAAEARTTALEADVARLTAERDTARHAALEECVKLAEATVNRYYEGQSVIDVRFSNIRGPKWADGKAIADAIRAIAGVRA